MISFFVLTSEEHIVPMLLIRNTVSASLDYFYKFI